jgi:hypothetical protein
MANDRFNPVIGSVDFDGTEFILYMVNLPSGELQGKRTAQEGCSEVCKEIFAVQADFGGKAGVTEDDFKQLSTNIDRIARLDVFIEPVKRFLERLIGTRYVLDDQLQRRIFTIAAQVDRRSLETPELLASYKLTRAYRSMAAKKAVKTRLKNEEAVKAETAAKEEAAKEAAAKEAAAKEAAAKAEAAVRAVAEPAAAPESAPVSPAPAVSADLPIDMS